MKYIFYKIIFLNGKNKRIYKKESSIKLYCKLNGKMIDIKKYKELCKKPKTKKVKSTKTKKTYKKVKTKSLKKTKTYRGGVEAKELRELREEINEFNNIDQKSLETSEDYDYLIDLHTRIGDARTKSMRFGNVNDNIHLIPMHSKVYKILLRHGYTLAENGRDFIRPAVGGARPRGRVSRLTHRY